MRKAGGLIAIIAGVLGFFGAGSMALTTSTLARGTLELGVIMAMFPDAEQPALPALALAVLGGAGIVCSLLAIILGAVILKTRSLFPVFLLILAALVGFLGGPIVWAFMALALMGGMLALIGSVFALLFPKKNPDIK